MAKITINDILASFAGTTAINARLQQVEDELNDKVLYRTNPVGEPNDMSNDLDMGGFDLLNVNNIGGTGSLDADTLEGISAAQFVRSDEADTALGPLTVTSGVVADLTGDSAGVHTGSVVGTTVSASGGFTGDITGTLTGNVIGNLTGFVTGPIYVSQNAPTDPTTYPLLAAGNSIGFEDVYTDSGLVWNGTQNRLTLTELVGNVVGNVTGNLTGNVTGNLVGEVTGPTYVVNDNPPDTTMFPLIVGSNAIGQEDVSTDGSFKWNASANELTVPTVVAALTGNADTATLAANSTLLNSIASGSFARSDQVDSISQPWTFTANVGLDGGWDINGTAVTATATEINRSIHFPDTAAPAIADVATRASKFLGFDGSGELTYLTGGGSATDAALVSLLDTAGYYPGTDVEAALENLGQSGVNRGASIIGYAETRHSSTIAKEGIDTLFELVEGEQVYLQSATLIYSLLNGNIIITSGLTSNATVTCSDIVSGVSKTILIPASGGARTLTYDANWRFMQSTPPTVIPDGKIMMLEVWATGTTNSDVLVRATLEP